MPSYRPQPSHVLPPELLRGQDGFTLIEVLVGMVLLAVVLGALMGPLVGAQRNQARTASYSYSQQRARAGLNEIVTQVRQSWEILSDTGNAVEMNLTQGGVSQQVYYECDIPQPGTQYHECVRVSSAVGGTLPSLSSGTVVVTNLLNGTATDPVFSFSPDPVAPYYMTATIKVPASNGKAYGLGNSIAFSDGALMRNLNVGN